MKGVRGKGRQTRATALPDTEEEKRHGTMEEEAPLEGAGATESEEDEEEPVVRPKVFTAHTGGGELSTVSFMEEIREFVHRSKQTETILFEQIKQLRGDMVSKSMRDSEVHYEHPVQQYPYSIRPDNPRLQAETSTHLLKAGPHGKFNPLQTSRPVSLSDWPIQPLQDNDPPIRTARPYVSEPRIPEFKEGEDPESFFVRFERMARTWGWQPFEWAPRVVTLLTGRALEAYAGMDEEQSESYDAIKAAVLMKFNVTEETYRQ